MVKRLIIEFIYIYKRLINKNNLNKLIKLNN